MTKTCRNCGHPNVNRPRGLCWKCWHNVLIREQYASKNATFNRVGGNVGYTVAPAAFPTYSKPGSEGKIAVMEERARLGQCLWHPDDVA